MTLNVMRSILELHKKGELETDQALELIAEVITANIYNQQIPNNNHWVSTRTDESFPTDQEQS